MTPVTVPQRRADTTAAATLRARVEQDRRNALQAALDVAERADDSQESLNLLETALTRHDLLSQRLERLNAVQVTSEPDLYQRGDPERSFFEDLAAVAKGGPATGAHDRLGRHAAYEESRSRQSGISARDFGIRVAEQRALSTTSGAGGELVPPRWMTELWASVSRAACPLKGLVTRVDLPPDGLSLVVPRFDSVAGVLPEQVENTAAPDQHSATDDVTTPVRTFVGDDLLSQQLYDRGPLASDEIILNDFAGNYGQALASEMMNGTGTNGHLLGLLNVTGIETVTYTSASPTGTAMIQSIAQCGAVVADSRQRSPSAIVMRGARWFWLSGSPDGTAQSSAQRIGTGLIPDDTDTGPYGPLCGLPVYHDQTIPTTVNTNQDVIVLCRAKDLILLEEPEGPRFSAFLGSNDAGELTVVVQWHAYTAFVPNLYPAGIGVVKGTGLAVPSGW